jgi:hypothetical protein
VPPSRLSELSVDEIRERYARAEEPVSAQTLSKLKRDPRHGVRVIYEALKKRSERDSAERTRLDAMLTFERVLWRAGVQHIAGVDTTGRRSRQSEVSAGLEDPFERAGRGQYPGPAVVVVQGVERG